MKEIQLTQGQVAIVDDEDFERVNQFKWCAAVRKNYTVKRFVALRKYRSESGKIVFEYLHRFIMHAPRHRLVDHQDHDTLNCRKSNLRICTYVQNGQNRFVSSNNKSGYKGVTLRGKTFTACINSNGKTIYLGSFNDVLDAAMAYDKAAKKYYGEYACGNFT